MTKLMFSVFTIFIIGIFVLGIVGCPDTNTDDDDMDDITGTDELDPDATSICDESSDTNPLIGCWEITVGDGDNAGDYSLTFTAEEFAIEMSGSDGDGDDDTASLSRLAACDVTYAAAAFAVSNCVGDTTVADGEIAYTVAGTTLNITIGAVAYLSGVDFARVE